nr:50S ribosomal protein L14 [Cavernulicola chilensis]
MIYIQSYLEVLDNSGAKEVKCIGIPKKTKQRYARVGDKIVVSVRKTYTLPDLDSTKRLRVSKGDVCYAVVVRTRKETFGTSSTWTRFSSNAVVLLTPTEASLGTRVKGVVSYQLRYKKWSKILSLARDVL